MDASGSLSAEYSRIARDYARQWSPVIRPMALPLLSALPLRGARTVLDVGTGTGALLADLRSAAPAALIAGVDRAEGMVRFAKEAGWPLLAVSDGARLCVRPQSVDVAVLIFVLFHMPDPVACLREVRRTLTESGRIGIVCWGADPGVPGASIWTQELDREGAPPDPRNPSVMQAARMNSPEKLAALLEESGLRVTEISARVFSHRWTAENLLPFQLVCGIASRRLPGLDHRSRTRCISRVRERLGKFSEEQLEYRPEVLFATAA
jgi:SAM-dependent methyltransferase